MRTTAEHQAFLGRSFERGGHRCHGCFAEARTHLHVLRYRPERYVPVCGSCYEAIHLGEPGHFEVNRRLLEIRSRYLSALPIGHFPG